MLEAARRLAPAPVRTVTPLHGGGNSMVYGVETTEGARYALKRYPRNDTRGRRQLAESRALRFMERQGLAYVPGLLAADLDSGYNLLSWLDGTVPGSLSAEDLRQFAEFQIALDRAGGAGKEEKIGEASEACLSGARILSHIDGRLARLQALRGECQELDAFFDKGLTPARRRFEEEARKVYDRLALSFDEDLPSEKQTLIVSDFGAHNALRHPSGRLLFLDFEYFGWDDPLTSVANFVLHPGMRLSVSQKVFFRDCLLVHFGGDSAAERLTVLMPLFALRWGVIILGEFLPEKWTQRRRAGQAGNWNQARRQQLAKAKRLLEPFLTAAS